MFAATPTNQTAPALTAAEITPDDDTDLPYATRSLYVGGEGDVTVLMSDGDGEVTFVGVPAGSILPICARRVLAAGTTATALVALR